MNVLNCLQKLSQPKASLRKIWQADTKAKAETIFNLFIEIYEPKYPKAALCLQKIVPNSSHYLIFQLSIFRVSAPEIQWNPPSPRSVTAPSAQRAVCNAMESCTSCCTWCSSWANAWSKTSLSYAASTISLKSSRASHWKIELIPLNPTRSRHGPIFSNTNFDSNSF